MGKNVHFRNPIFFKQEKTRSFNFTNFFLFCMMTFLLKCSYAQSISESFLTLGTSNWTVPADVYSITVQCWGGGGGGGGAKGANLTGNARGNGGGGGGYSTTTFSVLPGQVYSVTVGGGGSTSSGGNGGPGGTSTFSGTAGTVSANGGAGGTGANCSNCGAGGAAAAGGAGANYNGGAGGVAGSNGNGGGGGAGTTGNGQPGTNTAGGAGGTGSPAGGAGGGARTGGDDGATGSAPGGGGGGARAGYLGNRPGGAGARGQIIITYCRTIAGTISAPINCLGDAIITSSGHSGTTSFTLMGSTSSTGTYTDISTQASSTFTVPSSSIYYWWKIRYNTPCPTGTSPVSNAVFAMPRNFAGNVTLSENAVMAGTYDLGANDFTLNSTATITTVQGCPLVINARNITIDGTIDGNGKGASGGNGGTKGGDANKDAGCNTNSYANKGSGGTAAAGSGGGAGGQNGVNGLDNCGVCLYNNVAGGGGGGAGQGGGYGGKGGTSVAESWNSATGGSGGGTDIFIGTCSDVNACSSSGAQACPGAGATQTSNSFDNVNDVAIGGGGGGAAGGGGSNVAGADGSKGGNGGGAVKLYFTGTFTMGASGRINVNGETGGSGGNGARGESILGGAGSVWGAGGGGGGAGGGAGGGVLIYANSCSATINMAAGAQINANGGAGGTGGAGGNNDNQPNAEAKAGVTGKGGGGGGGGRIKIYRSACGNYSNNAALNVNAGNRGGTLSPGNAEAGAILVTDLFALANAKTISASATTVCYDGAVDLTGNTPTNGTCSYSYQWYQSTSGCGETFTDGSAVLPSTNWSPLSNSNAEDITVSNLTQTSCFIRKTISGNCIQWSNQVTVYVSGESTPNGVVASASSSFTCNVKGNQWHYFRNDAGEIIAAINSDGNDLGSVTMEVTILPNPEVHGSGGFGHNAMCNGTNELTLRRWHTLTIENTPVSGNTKLRYFFTADDYTNYTTQIASMIGQGYPYAQCYGLTLDAGDLALSKNETYDLPIVSSSLNGGPSGSVVYELSLSPANLRLMNGTASNMIASGPTTFKWHTNGGIGEPLPVELLAFTGFNDGDKNVLNWTTASERNTDRFEVEKSSSGTADWQYIGFQKAVGNNQGRLAYTFYDNTPQKGHNYYRLKIKDDDASYTYSKIIDIPVDDFSETAEIRLFPNPAGNQINIMMPSTKEVQTILRIDNMLGQELLSVDVSLQKGWNNLPVDISMLPAGTYLVSVTDVSGKKHIEKLIKN